MSSYAPFLVGLAVTLSSAVMAWYVIDRWIEDLENGGGYNEETRRRLKLRVTRDADAVQSVAGILAVAGAFLVDRDEGTIGPLSVAMATGALLVVGSVGLLMWDPLKYKAWGPFTPLTVGLVVGNFVGVFFVWSPW